MAYDYLTGALKTVAKSLDGRVTAVESGIPETDIPAIAEQVAPLITVDVTKDDVGLGNVDNISDADKAAEGPIAAAISDAIAGVTANSLGLGNVENFSRAEMAAAGPIGEALQKRLRFDVAHVLTYAEAKQASDNLLLFTDDVTRDILLERALPGYDGDDAPILNTILATKRAIRIRPDAEIGQLTLKTPVFAPQPNTKIIMAGGEQSVAWVRDLGHIDSTLICGDPVSTAGGAAGLHIEDIFFVHPYRLGFYFGPDGASNGDPLPGKLTGGQSHLEIHGAQSAMVRVGGFGCQHIVSVFGGAGCVVERPFFYGGVWDPDYAVAQESVSQVRFTKSLFHGHGTTHSVRGGLAYGGNTPRDDARRPVIIENKTVQAKRRVGPKYAVLIESGEDIVVEPLFSGGFAHSNVAIIPVAGGQVLNPWIRNGYIDESNEAIIYVEPVSDDLTPDSLTISNVMMNGQEVSRRAIHIPNDGAIFAVRRLDLHDFKIRAVLGGGIDVRGVDGGSISHGSIAGYNMVREDVLNGGGAGCAAILVAGITRNLFTDFVRVGGGINRDMEGDSIGTGGLSPNATQFGYYDVTSGQGNFHHKIRAVNFGLAGGAAATGVADTTP